jgi:SAM-dependent methyltransferase
VAAWLRTFEIDGEERTDTTLRTRLVEHYVDVPGRSFLDLGAADGYESRALALRGAGRVVAVEAKRKPYELARAAQEELGLENLDVRLLDARSIDEHGLGVFDVVLCFGLLYHMQNPFDLLRRIRAVCGDTLLLETHVAPDTRRGLREVHGVLPRALSTVELDGVGFEGVVFPTSGDLPETKGSVDAPWSFWLTIPSLVKALVRAGFAVDDLHHELDGSEPPPVAHAGRELGFGRWNTKVWVVASPRHEPASPAASGIRVVERGREPLAARAARRARRLVRPG